jgi:CobQ-like glutamine amidotransferase family enzyme
MSINGNVNISEESQRTIDGLEVGQTAYLMNPHDCGSENQNEVEIFEVKITEMSEDGKISFEEPNNEGFKHYGGSVYKNDWIKDDGCMLFTDNKELAEQVLEQVHEGKYALEIEAHKLFSENNNNLLSEKFEEFTPRIKKRKPSR